MLVGVLEGFYGRPWHPHQREQLLEWCVFRFVLLLIIHKIV